MSRLLVGFERAGCDVQRREDLVVCLPGWESAYLSFVETAGFRRLFWDRMTVVVENEGLVSYRFHYWSSAQAFMHLLISVLFALEAWTHAHEPARTQGPWVWLACFVISHLIPGLLALGSFRWSRLQALRRAELLNEG